VFAEVDIAEVVRQVLEFARVRCDTNLGASRAIEVRSDGVQCALVRGVASELREVLTNLVSNAIDAMPMGGCLRVTTRRSGEHYKILVTDSGVGIPADVLPRVFEPFFSTKGQQGNGLGLSIVQGVVRRHGGSIEVETSEGRGTTMTVSLPRADVGKGFDEFAGDVVESERMGSRVDKLPRVLIVDDDPRLLSQLGRMLARLGLDFEAVPDGGAGLQVFEAAARPFDCVITDICMPVSDGLELAKAVLARRPGTRVILMSGSASAVHEARRSIGGTLEAIVKPLTYEQLRQTLAGGESAS
jgi:CheY-like chemotaxis protein